MCQDRRISLFMGPLCRVKYKIMYVLWCRTVNMLTRVLFLYLFLLSFATRAINTETKLLRLHKIFDTSVHISAIYVYVYIERDIDSHIYTWW